MKNQPDKIYATPNFDRRWQTKAIDDESVEYIRKDVLIENALKWYCLDCECNDNCKADYKCFFRQEYKRYLEGNNNAIPPKFNNSINPDGSVTENYHYRHFIRKVRDTLIEKACEWIKTNMDDYIYVEYDTVTGMPTNEAHIAYKKVVEDFKNYMEE